MENCKNVNQSDVNVGCQTVSDEKEYVLSEEECGNVVCDEGTVVAAAAAAAGEHDLEEDDEDYYEDAVDNLTLDSSGTADDDFSGCYSLTAEHETDALQPLCSNVQGLSDEMLTGADAGADTMCEDEKEEAAGDDAVIIDEEVLRQKEACLTDEQKQVIYRNIFFILLFCFHEIILLCARES